MNETRSSLHLVTGSARLAGVIGWPVSHSLSPRLHGYWLQMHRIDGLYMPLSIAPDNFDPVVRSLPKAGFCGFNITVPYKERILPLLDHVDPRAAQLGAVNTVVVREDGSLEGLNTDGFGFAENLSEQVPDWAARGGAAMILGAGGAARAVGLALIDRGVRTIKIANRTPDRAREVAGLLTEAGARVEVLAFPPEDAALEDVSLLVNTTALGMKGSPPLDMPLRGLPETAIVTDIVYNPLETRLLRDATARGLVTVDGIGMLLHQARGGFERWFGRAVPVTRDLRRIVLRGLA